MILTNIEAALAAVSAIAEAKEKVAIRQAETQNITQELSEDLWLSLRVLFTQTILTAKALSLSGTERKAEYLQTVYSRSVWAKNCMEARTDLEHLLQDFASEAGSILFLHVPAVRAKFYVGSNLTAAPFGESVLNAFPSATLDIREASNCYALELWPASVFHHMRVLEFGLGALASRFGVSVDRSTWHQVIEAIEGKIRKITPETGGADWKQQQKDFSDAATQFMFFKDAWRNHIMHVRDVYDEGRATSIMQHTKEFMQKLAAIGLVE